MNNTRIDITYIFDYITYSFCVWHYLTQKTRKERNILFHPNASLYVLDIHISNIPAQSVALCVIDDSSFGPTTPWFERVVNRTHTNPTKHRHSKSYCGSSLVFLAHQHHSHPSNIQFVQNPDKICRWSKTIHHSHKTKE